MRLVIKRCFGAFLLYRLTLILVILTCLSDADAARPGGAPERKEHQFLAKVIQTNRDGSADVRIEGEYGRQEYGCHLGEKFALNHPVITLPHRLSLNSLSLNEYIYVTTGHDWIPISISKFNDRLKS